MAGLLHFWEIAEALGLLGSLSPAYFVVPATALPGADDVVYNQVNNTAYNKLR